MLTCLYGLKLDQINYQLCLHVLFQQPWSMLSAMSIMLKYILSFKLFLYYNYI